MENKKGGIIIWIVIAIVFTIFGVYLALHYLV